MCDLSRKKRVRAKKVKVYKICVERDNKFYAVLSGMEIKTGLVKDLEFWEEAQKYFLGFGRRFDVFMVDDKWSVRNFKTDGLFYNDLAVGRTTGFESLEVAILNQKEYVGETVMLELELTGALVSGTGRSLSYNPYIQEGVVYAGREILSVKKL